MSMETSPSIPSPQKSKFFINPPTEVTSDATFEKLKRERPELYRQLMEIRDRLHQPIAEDGPVFLANAGLMEAYAVYETMGNRWESLVRANDLYSYTKQLFYKRGSSSILSLEYPPRFHDDGSFDEAIMRLSFSYEDKDGINAEIQRGFVRKTSIDKEINQTKRSAHHDVFSLPSVLQCHGVAASLLQSSLAEYDAAGIEEILLFADVDVGSYAWASYGFGFDEQTMNKNRKRIFFEQAKLNMQIVLAQVGLEDDVALNMRVSDELERAITPQEIASIGADGPFFARDKDGGWALIQEKEDARANDRSIYHLGKIALINNGWWAKLELTHHGPQQGKNRVLFEQALARRIKRMSQADL